MRRVLSIAAVVFLLMGGVFEFLLSGYRVSALLCLFFAAVCGFYAIARKRDRIWKVLRRIGYICLSAGLVLFLITEIPIIGDARSDDDTSADWVIVMGAGVTNGHPSLSLLNRLEAAEAWLTEHPKGRAVLSGCQGSNESISEAQCMYDWLTAQGIDPHRLVLEEQAENSYENLLYSLDMIGDCGGDTVHVALLSSEYHLHRLCVMARQMGCDPVRVAAPTTRPALRINYTVREAFAMWRLWTLGMG